MRAQQKARRSDFFKSAVLTLLALVVMGVLLFPVYYMFMVSLKPVGTLATTSLEVIPSKVTLDNYLEILVGHYEATLDVKSFALRAQNATISDALNRYEVDLYDGVVAGDYPVKFTLSNAKILERRGGQERGERDATIIVGGDYLKVGADSAETITAARRLTVEARKIVVKVSGPGGAPLDLSKFREVAPGVYEAENARLYLEDGGRISAEKCTVETTSFSYIRLAKVGGEIWGYMSRSLIIASLTVVLTLLFVVPSAYAFSRLKFFGKGHILYSYLMFTQVAGGLGIAGLVALYGMLVRLNLVNNIFVLPVIYAAGSVPFNTWLLKGYLDSISPDFDEAALVDGASYAQIIGQVLVPMALPGIATVAIFSFIGGWTELILANLLLNQENHPLTVYIYVLLTNLRNVSWNQFAAAALIFALPVVVMFLLAQNYVRSGLTMGGLKE